MVQQGRVLHDRAEAATGRRIWSETQTFKDSRTTKQIENMALSIEGTEMKQLMVRDVTLQTTGELLAVIPKKRK